MNALSVQRDLPDGDAALSTLVFAVDPAGCGGIVLRGRPGPARDQWLRVTRRLLPTDSPWRKIPLNVSDDRLLGGLDFAATVSSKKPVFASGLLEAANGGALLLSMAERVPHSSAALISAALERGCVLVERDGMARRRASRFGVIALDEGLDDEESVAPVLTERLALYLRTDTVAAEEMDLRDWSASDVESARKRFAGIATDDSIIEWVCHCADAFAITSSRGALLSLHVARVLAALAGRDHVSESEAGLAVRLVLPQRARAVPAGPEEPPQDADANEDPGPEEAANQQEPAAQEEPPTSGGVPPEEVMVEAVHAAIPPGLLERLEAQRASQRRLTLGGRMGQRRVSPRRGRPVGVRRTDSVRGQRLNVLATLKAAAPWQRLRRGSPSGDQPLLALRKEDLHVTRYEDRVETTTIFVVDASGSQAAQRLAEVKGAVELLLNDCYVRRDQVALIAFRGTGAHMLLSPTRALARARRSLASLPGGGGTPLAAGLDAARDAAATIARGGRLPAIVLLTDGRANIARDQTPGAECAEREAIAAAQVLRADGYRSVLVDTSRRPRPRARVLADAMGAIYVPLPRADAAAISETVQRSVA